MTEQKTADSPRRDEIIQKTTELFLELGFSATSMSKVAAACGMTKASLYHHFSGKEELFIACVTHGYQPALEALKVLEKDAQLDTERKVRRAIDIIYDITINSPVGRMSPLIAEVSRTFPIVARSFHTDYIAPQQELIWSIIRAGIDAGKFKNIDDKNFFHLLFGPVVTLSLSREMFASFDDLDEHFPVEQLKQAHIQSIMDLLLKH